MTASIASTRVVIDSNVWISALVFGGQPRKVFERIIQQGQLIICSEAIVTEIRRVLSRKFPDFVHDFELLLIALERVIITIPLGSITIAVCRDVDDNKILETAVLGDAEVIISGDNDLLILEHYQSIAIVTPNRWLETSE